MSLDLENDYKKAKDKIKSAKTYVDVKKQYLEATKKNAKDNFEKKKSEVTESLNKLKDKKKKFERNVKNQFEQLLDINTILGSSGSNTTNYLKNLFIRTLRNIEPKIAEILNEEVIKAVGCDQQQAYVAQTIYVKVKSIDLSEALKTDPQSVIGRCIYEKRTIIPNDTPFSMNRELYNRIQLENTSYNTQYGTLYLGKSRQPLFDITFVQTNNLGEYGPWYKVDLVNRLQGNKVAEFLVDYFKTIKVVEFHNIIASIMEQLTGMISITIGPGDFKLEDTLKFQKILQRILGLCFDNDTEIDVSGIAKLSELDGVDNSFFEFTSNDLRDIEERISDIRKGVIKFLECNNVDIPVDAAAILNSLNNLIFVPDNKIVEAVNNVTESVSPDKDGIGINIAINVNFIKLLSQGLVMSLLSPKVLLPIFIVIEALGRPLKDIINSFMDLVKEFKKMIINLMSRIGALFVQELFELIRKDIKNLVQQIIADIIIEKNNKKLLMILKLVQILLIVAQLISDWRRCKSVIDEILALLKLIPGFSTGLPLPLLFASSLLDGYSETRAFIGTIEELQKLGIPTGPMPDGSPNLDLLSKLGQMKAMANEEAENGKLTVAIPPLTITPAGLTIPAPASGKNGV